MTNKYCEFKEVSKGVYEIWNKIYNTKVGYIKKARMGTWMHWQLFSADKNDIIKLVEEHSRKDVKHYEDSWDIRPSDLIEEIKKLNIGFTNGCLKEIVPFITSLYRKERLERSHTHSVREGKND